ncbi:MAG: peroxiredoxin [Burkholderiales bacterium]|nr:peroxiredoxin [Burkholderiales bacterium]
MKTSSQLPDIELSTSGGGRFKISDCRGRFVVLYFYPKDSTPGCTTEGLDFSALHAQFVAANAMVLGVSRDSVKSHDHFCAKQGFPFPLISDPDEKLCAQFDVIHMKNMYGKQVRGVVRSTFLIGPDGKLRQEWRGVKVAGHAQAVLDAVRAQPK